jgi:hypothetical protein
MNEGCEAMKNTFDIVIEHNANKKTVIKSAKVNNTQKGEGYATTGKIVYPAYFHHLKIL